MFKKYFFYLTMLAMWHNVAHALDIQRWQSPQGTEILLVERHQLPMVDYAVIFKNAGSANDPDGKSNVANYTADLIGSGTNQLNEEEFNQKINNIGSNIAGNSSSEYSSFVFRSLSRPDVLHETAHLFNQAITQPSFDETVLQRMKNQDIQSLKYQEEDANFIASRALTRLNYPQHPYGRWAFQTAEKIQAVQRADLIDFHRQNYAQNNAIVVMVGDINRQQAEKLVAQTLNGLPEKAQHNTDLPEVPIHAQQRQNIPFSGSTQNVIAIGLPVLKADSPDYFAMMLGNYILGGGGFDSRLMKVLRDKHGYTYGASSSVAAYRQTAPFTISFATQSQNSQAALAATQQVLADFVTHGATETELKQAKANITGNFPLRLDSNAKLLNVLVSMAYYNRPNDWLDTYNDKINALTIDDVKRAWQRNVQPEKLNIVVVGNEKTK